MVNKRNPTHSTQSPMSAAGDSPPCDPTAEIKLQCERSLTAFRRGNPTEALGLMRDALDKHGDSALVHRVHGAIHAKLTSMIEDPVVKQRHSKAAIDSAQKATELSPNSIEFAHFYGSMLFNYLGDYDLALEECERALYRVKNPVDPADEFGETSAAASTPEARIKQVQGELCNLIRNCNIASISNWMKTTNENKYRLININNQVEYHQLI